MFSSLYIACQNRDGDLGDFFKYENQPWPPFLAQAGNLCVGQKAELIKYLEPLDKTQPSTLDVIILDGAVIIQMLLKGTAHTFTEYVQVVYFPYIVKQLSTAKA